MNVPNLPGGWAGIIGFIVGGGIGGFFFPPTTNVLGQSVVSPGMFVCGLVGAVGAALFWEYR